MAHISSITTRLVSGLCLALLVAVSPFQSWGQEAKRAGTVLAADGTVEVRAQGEATWEPLRFHDDVLVHDTVRTGENSKVKILLRDDSIITLAEDSEMEFTEFRLTQQQRRNVMSLFVGTLKVLTTRIFGADSATEVHTPNAVAGVRGTVFVVRFIPPDLTNIFSEENTVTAQNINKRLEEVAESFNTTIRGFNPPATPTETTPAQAQQLQDQLAMNVQAPGALTPALGDNVQQGAEAPQAPGPEAERPANPHDEDVITPDIIFRETPIIIPIPEPR